MNSWPACRMCALVDKHFAGKISPLEEQTMRSHLAGCVPCRDYYEGHLVLSEVDPKGLDAATRIAYGLGLRSRPRPFLAMPIAAVVAAAVVVLMVFWLAPEGGESRTGFAARGPGDLAARLLVYRLQPDSVATPVADEISATDELAFAYQNAANKKRLLVFGVDELDAVYWYHPGWQDSSENPAAIPIDPGPEVHELPVAVSHDVQGDSLRICGVFLDEPSTVRQAEEIVRRRDPQTGSMPWPDAFQDCLLLRVRH